MCSDYFHRRNEKWSKAVVTAIEFFPSPVFAGKLTAYLGQFSGLDTVKRAVINLAANWFAASLAQVMPMLLSSDQRGLLEWLRLERLSDIVQNTLGFGLGIAWNALFSQFAPEDRNWDLPHLIGLAGYLAVVMLVVFRLAAIVADPPVTIWDRQLALLSFAFYVVCAFTLVLFLNALLHPGWIGGLESLPILLVLSAAMSAMVARVNLNDVSEQDDERISWLRGPSALLLLVPCVWPWIPILWLLAGTENLGAKEHWFQLIEMVSGLASSIQASSLLTDATDELAASLGICDSSHCNQKWLFVMLQIVLAALITIVLIPIIAPLAAETSTVEQADGEGRIERGETQPLLRRLRNKFRRGHQGSK